MINAAAYRAFLAHQCPQVLATKATRRIAERNLNFVLENQNPDGSWYYAFDGVRDFVDHFHTCFVMKALAKIHSLTGIPRAWTRIGRGVDYYLANLFDDDGLPKPFSKAPRLTVYKRELYDCAECINLCLLLQIAFLSWSETRNRGRRNSRGLDQAGRLVPVTAAALRLGQRADAPLGAVADVPQPGLLPREQKMAQHAETPSLCQP